MRAKHSIFGQLKGPEDRSIDNLRLSSVCRYERQPIQYESTVVQKERLGRHVTWLLYMAPCSNALLTRTLSDPHIPLAELQTMSNPGSIYSSSLSDEPQTYVQDVSAAVTPPVAQGQREADKGIAERHKMRVSLVLPLVHHAP